MPRLLALIFDLDGTLIDSAADLRQAVNTLLAAHGRRAVTLDEIKTFVGDGLQTLMQRAFSTTGETLPERATKNVLDDMLKLYKDQTASRDQLYPLALETIDSFRAHGVKIGLCTNKLYQPTLKLLDDIGIRDRFDCIAGCDSFAFYKPHPEHVLGVARAVGAPPENCVMVGDSVNDIRAAQSAGVSSIAVSHGYGANVATLGADAVIAGFAELPDALRHLGFDILS